MARSEHDIAHAYSPELRLHAREWEQRSHRIVTGKVNQPKKAPDIQGDEYPGPGVAIEVGRRKLVFSLMSCGNRQQTDLPQFLVRINHLLELSGLLHLA